jgi:hypothetical protein
MSDFPEVGTLLNQANAHLLANEADAADDEPAVAAWHRTALDSVRSLSTGGSGVERVIGGVPAAARRPAAHRDQLGEHSGEYRGQQQDHVVAAFA